MFYRIILYLSIFIFPTVTWADNNASSTVGVTGNVIKALTVLDATQGIEMPDLTLPDAGETTTVELLCVSSGASTVVFDDRGGNPFADGNPAATAVAGGSTNAGVGDPDGKCASIIVQGQANFAFTATNEVSDVVLATGVTLNNLNCDITNSGTFSAGGFATVSCGGFITVDESASAGAYTSTVNVVMVYDQTDVICFGQFAFATKMLLTKGICCYIISYFD